MNSNCFVLFCFSIQIFSDHYYIQAFYIAPEESNYLGSKSTFCLIFSMLFNHHLSDFLYLLSWEIIMYNLWSCWVLNKIIYLKFLGENLECHPEDHTYYMVGPP